MAPITRIRRPIEPAGSPPPARGSRIVVPEDGISVAGESIRCYRQPTMLSNTLFRVPRNDGLHLLQRRGDAGARELTSWRLRLRPGGSATFRADGEETIFVLQEGRGIVAAGGRQWPVARRGAVRRRSSAGTTRGCGRQRARARELRARGARYSRSRFTRAAAHGR